MSFLRIPLGCIVFGHNQIWFYMVWQSRQFLFLPRVPYISQNWTVKFWKVMWNAETWISEFGAKYISKHRIKILILIHKPVPANHLRITYRPPTDPPYQYGRVRALAMVSAWRGDRLRLSPCSLGLPRLGVLPRLGGFRLLVIRRVLGLPCRGGSKRRIREVVRIPMDSYCFDDGNQNPYAFIRFLTMVARIPLNSYGFRRCWSRSSLVLMDSYAG